MIKLHATFRLELGKLREINGLITRRAFANPRLHYVLSMLLESGSVKSSTGYGLFAITSAVYRQREGVQRTK